MIFRFSEPSDMQYFKIAVNGITVFGLAFRKIDSIEYNGDIFAFYAVFIDDRVADKVT